MGGERGVSVGNKLFGVGASVAHSTETRSLKDIGIPSQVESSTFPSATMSKYFFRLVGCVSKPLSTKEEVISSLDRQELYKKQKLVSGLHSRKGEEKSSS